MLLRPLSWYNKLSEPKARKTEHLFLLEGFRGVEQMLNNHPHSVDELLITEKYQWLAQEYRVPHRILLPQQIKKFCTSVTPREVIAVVKIPENSCSSVMPVDPGDRVLFLDGVQDPGNVGTLIRTAAALNYSGCILTSKCADPFSPKSVQSTAGALLGLWIRRTHDYSTLLWEFKNRGYKIVSAAVEGAKAIDFAEYPRHILALGSEGTGLTQNVVALSDQVFQIPIDAKAVESLNVAACGAICMFMASNKLRIS